MLIIVGDCNFADGFFDMGFGTGSSIKKGANPFQHIKADDSEDYWIGNFECVALISLIKREQKQSNL